MKSSKMTRWFFSLCTVTAFMVAFAVPAHAVPTLRLDDGVNPAITIADGDALDLAVGVGAVTFVGTYGSWSLNVSTGQSKPFLGGVEAVNMDLNTVNTSIGPANLAIMFSDTDFVSNPSFGSMVLDIGGTTDGTVTAKAYYDSNNALFGLTTQIDGDLGPFGTGAFSGTSSGLLGLTPGASYSLTQFVSISHAGNGRLPQVTSFDFELQAIPEPGTILLLGSGLVGLGFILKRKRRL